MANYCGVIDELLRQREPIATLGILFKTSAESMTLAEQIAEVLVPSARLAFLTVIMLFIPCLATTATIQQETKSWRWTAAAIALTLALSLGAGIVVYQIGMLVR